MWKSVSILVVCFALLTIGLHIVQSQDYTELPPRIVDVWPFSGVEISPYEALVLTFDQPMNHVSVEEAFSISPAAPGTFSWSDQRTVQFTPTAPWTAAASYTVTIDSTALAENDLSLETPYQFRVNTAPPLQVMSVSPEPGTTEVDPYRIRVMVSFDRPVVALGSTTEMDELPNPLSFEPAIEGEGEWINTFIYSFRSKGWLRGGTEYTAHVSAGLTAVDGSVLDDSFLWTFTTVPPHVENIQLKDGQNYGLLDTQVEVRFSQPMDIASTEAAFRLRCGAQESDGSFEWSESTQSLTFVPAHLLTLDSRYFVVIDSTARGHAGGNLDDRLVYSFSTVPFPYVQSTDPADGASGVYEGSDVLLTFPTVMNTETFRDRIVISPEPEEWIPEIHDSVDHTTLALRFNKIRGTTYTVTLLAGAEDIYGNAIRDDYVLAFTVERPIEPSPTLHMSERGWLSIVGAYHPDTRVPMKVRGPIEVEYSLYQINLQKLADEDPSTAYRGKMIRTWMAQYETGSTTEQVDVPLASDNGGALAPGLYEFQTVWHVVGEDREYTSTHVLAVANTAITVKDSEVKDLIWVTDMVTGHPVPDASVAIYGRDGFLAGGRTNADGVFLPPIDLTTDVVEADSGDSNAPEERGLPSYIVVEGAGRYGVWTNSNELKMPTSLAYLYTDRPAYRPGEPVYFRGVIRDRVDMDFSVPDAESVHVVAGYGGDDSLFEAEIPVSAFGTFSGTIQLPSDLQPGTYFIRLVDFNAPPSTDSSDYPVDWDAYWFNQRYFHNEIAFEVADYRVPEYKINVTAEQDAIIQGDPVTFEAQAQYYAGGPVNKASVRWSTFATPFAFTYAGRTRYSFRDETLDYWVDLDTYGQETTETGDNGRYSFTTDQTIPQSPILVRLTATATISDESNIPISGTADVLLHPAAVYVGLRSVDHFAGPDKPVHIEIITVTPDSDIQPEQPVTLEVVEVRWERQSIPNQYGRYTWEHKEIPVVSGQTVTGIDGKANYAFSAPNAGIFRVRAVTQDEQGRANSSTLRVYVTADKNGLVDWGEATFSYRYGSNGLVMVADKESYKPTETAQILIANPLGNPTTALISMERAGVMAYDVVEVTGSSLMYALPIKDEYAPAVHVQVVLVKGISEENPDPAYLMNSLRLTVEPVARRLNVTITPSAGRTAPGEVLTFDICVTDYRNQPVQAELGLALVDEAVLALRPPNSMPLERRFYDSEQPDYVWTTTSLSAVLNTTPQIGEGPGMGGGDASAPEPLQAIRDDFVYTPLWAPHVVTDEAGCASASLTMPDNLTTWRLDARIVSQDMKIAQTETGIVSFIPLMIRPVVPRFFIVGDRVRLDAVVNNYTGSDQMVEATLFADGVQIDGSATQSVEIDSDDRALVSWWVTVDDVDGVDLTFAAASADGYQDAAKPALRTGPKDTIPVYPNTTPDTVGTSGTLFGSDSRLELINVPPHLADMDGALTVRLDPSLASAILDSLDFLKSYHDDCIEQRVSRFLPAIVAYQAAQNLGITGLVDEAEFRATVNTMLKRLAVDQNDDGGWGWFGRMESHVAVSTYTLYGLIEARDAGFQVDADMFDRAVRYVTDHWETPGVNMPGWKLNQQALQLYVLARIGLFNANRYGALLDERLEMSSTGRAYLVMAAHTALPEDSALTDRLVSDLVSASILSATGAHWEERWYGGGFWASDTRTTAVVLKALLQVDPDNPLLPNAVNWLMTARQGDHWLTTQENAWAIMALADWIVMTGQLESNYAYMVRLNQNTLAQGSFTPDSAPEIWQVSADDLVADRANALTIARGEGAGALYYTTHLDLALPLTEVGPISRGISVQRDYYVPSTRVPAQPLVEPILLGTVVLVRLSFTVPQDVYFFALENPLPSGAEIADPVLMTTDAFLSRLVRNEPFWFWGEEFIDRVDMRDRQVNLYADFLPRGSYAYTFAMTMTTAGEFQVLPAHAYAFYSPEVFGRTKPDWFVVTERMEPEIESGQG